MPELLQPTTKAQAKATVVPNISPKSSTALWTIDKSGTGEKSLEEIVQDAFPSPFIHVKDIPVEDLKVTIIPSGFSSLDAVRFLKKDRPELVVVGAGTSHGKSAFMLQVAANVAKQGNVFVYSLEMDERDIKARLIAGHSRIPMSLILSGNTPKHELKKSLAELGDRGLYFCTNGRKQISYIQQTSHEMAKRVGNPTLIVIDYLQLLKGPNRATRSNEIADILAEIKTLARELKCPILIGSQLNRNCERRGKDLEKTEGKADYTPIKSDLLDSSSVENDADVILFISRQHVYDRTREFEADIRIAKNRGGKLIDCIFKFEGEFCSFTDEI